MSFQPLLANTFCFFFSFFLFFPRDHGGSLQQGTVLVALAASHWLEVAAGDPQGPGVDSSPDDFVQCLMPDSNLYNPIKTALPLSA